MLYALNDNEQLVEARLADRVSHYRCPVCLMKVTLRSGSVKTPHFSHYRMNACIRYLYKGESVNHLKAKHDIYLGLKHLQNVSMEIYLSEIEQIPDVLVGSTAIEIQFSTISPKLIIERSEGYYSIGYDVIWVLDAATFKPSKLTHFHVSVMNAGVIYTYDVVRNVMCKYTFQYFDGMCWHYTQHPIEFEDILRPVKETERLFTLTNKNVSQMIQHARRKRDVTDVTLSALYQLQLNETDLPRFLYTVTPMEKYILNPPLEWKLYIVYHLHHNTFTRLDFTGFIRLRETIGAPDKRLVIEGLIHSMVTLMTIENTSELEISRQN